MLIYKLLDLERRLIWQTICFMKKCYFLLILPPIWWAVCWKNLKCYLLFTHTTFKRRAFQTCKKFSSNWNFCHKKLLKLFFLSNRYPSLNRFSVRRNKPLSGPRFKYSTLSWFLKGKHLPFFLCHDKWKLHIKLCT